MPLLTGKLAQRKSDQLVGGLQVVWKLRLCWLYRYPTGKRKRKYWRLINHRAIGIKKYSDSPNAIVRYERNLKGFASFLKIPKATGKIKTSNVMGNTD